MKKYKSALSIGDIVSLKNFTRRGLMGTNGEFDAGTELQVTDKHEMGFDAIDKDGRILSLLRDEHINYVGKEFTKQYK